MVPGAGPIASPATLATRYGPPAGADLEAVASVCGCAPAAVIAAHAEATYGVERLGFLPGFAYLAGLDARLADLPRRATPRPRVAAGSVGVAAGRTGVYPCDGPGGWHLLGDVAEVMFDPHRAAPALLAPGDAVRFEPVPEPAFLIRRAAARADAHTRAARARTAHAAAAGPVALEVLEPGQLTTVQDGGRAAWEAIGVGPSGPMDAWSHASANAAVGNAPTAAALECTLVGPTLRALVPVVVALAGAWAEATRDGVPVRSATPVPLRPGSVLRVGPLRLGCRLYLAVHGGLDVPTVLGSRATHLRAGFGGHEGRALRAGDRLRVGTEIDGGAVAGADALAAPGAIGADAPGAALLAADRPLRLWPGPAFDALPAAARHALLGSAWRVDARSDRVGVRLAGPAIDATGLVPVPSAPVITGLVQLPPDGCPIVLMADRQTTGGYPVLGALDGEGVAMLAQRRPGDPVRWTLA